MWTRRMKRGAAAAGAIAAITVALLCAVEIGSFLALGRASETPARALSVYDQDHTWAKTFWTEYDESRRFGYRPYVMWRRTPYAGRTIIVDASGLRRTEHSACAPGAATVFMFGGSTLWGTGAPDAETIPSLLAERFARAGRPVCIRNYGETAWVSTQEVVQLVLELKRGERPDLVVFYDGVNDVFAGWQAGRADVHQNFEQVKRQFEHRGASAERTFDYLFATNTARMLQRLAARGRAKEAHASGAPQRTEELAGAIATSYLANIAIVDALARTYGFRHEFFWQPVIFAGRKPLTPEEQAIRQSRAAAWQGIEPLYEATYALVRKEHRPGLTYVADAFAAHERRLYLDFAHVPPAGNELVADRMFDVLKERAR